ncbi:MAG: hypothetical protein PHU63_03480, partial [Candidatus ainarchaeum sp.]|nr:hypothetical protein [Candidatus ainarchaeum sp.]
YKAANGFVVARVKMDKGRRKRPKPAKGRSARHNYRFTPPGASHQAIAERKANRVYINCEVLGSYLIAEDGQHKYFEVVLADRNKESSKSNTTLRIGRAFRGLTSAGQKGRKRLKTRKHSDKKGTRGRRKARVRPHPTSLQKEFSTKVLESKPVEKIETKEKPKAVKKKVVKKKAKTE